VRALSSGAVAALSFAIVCWACFYEASAERTIARNSRFWWEERHPSDAESPRMWLAQKIVEFQHSKKPKISLARDNHFGERSIGLISNPCRMVNDEVRRIAPDHYPGLKIDEPDVYWLLWQTRLTPPNGMPKREAKWKRRCSAVIDKPYRDVELLGRDPRVDDCVCGGISHFDRMQAHNRHFRPDDGSGVQSRGIGTGLSCFRSIVGGTHRPIHMASMDQRDAPEPISSNPQRQRKDGNENGRDSSQPFGGYLGEHRNPLKDDAVFRGAFIIGGVIFFVLIAFGIRELIARRDQDRYLIGDTEEQEECANDRRDSTESKSSTKPR
jgi:hypothetical protein